MKQTQKTEKNTCVGSSFRGLAVATIKEGKALGIISHVNFDPIERKISSFVVKNSFWSKENGLIKVDSIVSVGEDIVLVDSLADFVSLEENSDLNSIDFKDIIGHNIITEDGTLIGRFIDAKFSTSTWRINEIMMKNNLVLNIIPSKVTIGKDEIIVPSNYLSKIIKNESSNSLDKYFGEDTEVETSDLAHKKVVKNDQKSTSQNL
jgi:uncharacterized protein YrrD